MADRPDVILGSQLTEIRDSQFAGYYGHAYCSDGFCTFDFNNEHFRFEKGNCLIVTRCDLIENVVQSPDFMVEVIYVSQEFIEVCTPQSNYGMKGHLALFNNPIMRLKPEQQAICAANFAYVGQRLRQTSHRFYREALSNAIERMIIDFFDFHADLHGMDKISSQNQRLMERFLEMLERGDFREHREIGYYADKLCVTPKYLSEVTKKVSGLPANYWITRYTSLDISRLLRDSSLSFTEISDLFGFSTLSQFSHYVQKNLGAKPRDFRE